MQSVLDRDTVQALSGACVAALNVFVDEATRTCEMFEKLRLRRGSAHAPRINLFVKSGDLIWLRSD